MEMEYGDGGMEHGIEGKSDWVYGYGVIGKMVHMRNDGH